MDIYLYMSVRVERDDVEWNFLVQGNDAMTESDFKPRHERLFPDDPATT